MNKRADPADESFENIVFGIIILILFVMYIAGKVHGWLYGPTAEEKLAMQERIKEQEAQVERERAEDREKGFHCLSMWDGSHRDIVNGVKMLMRDPNSFQHIDTYVYSKDADGNHKVTMNYRGANGFGAATSGTARGVFNNRTCSGYLTSSE